MLSEQMIFLVTANYVVANKWLQLINNCHLINNINIYYRTQTGKVGQSEGVFFALAIVTSNAIQTQGSKPVAFHLFAFINV